MTTVSSSTPAQASASRRDCSLATVYRAMTSAAPAIRWLSHETAAIWVTRIQPNTGMGQIRRTTSGATIRASTTNAATPGQWWAPPWYRLGNDSAAASTVTSTSNTQRRAGRFAGYSTGLRSLMLGIVPLAQASERRSRQAAAAMRTTAYPHRSANPVHGASAFCAFCAPPHRAAPAFEGR